MIKIYDMETLEEREILFRGGSGADVSAPVAEILRAVQERGDAALREYTLRFDGAAPDALAVTAEEVDQAAAQVEPAFLAVLEEAAEHIRAYHARQKRESFVMTEREGVVLGQRIIPLARVGIYVPGGTAAYPSTVLMNAIPARIAGEPPHPGRSQNRRRDPDLQGGRRPGGGRPGLRHRDHPSGG